jgi:hypothetical protein
VGEAIRRDLFQMILPMPEFSGIEVSDHYLKWSALVHAPTCFLNEPLALQRLHSEDAYSGRQDLHLARVSSCSTLTHSDCGFRRSRRSQTVCLLRGSTCTDAPEADEATTALIEEHRTWLDPAQLRRLERRVAIERLPAKLRRLVR